MSTLQIPDGFTKRRGHSNTVSGERPPSLDIEATRPLAVRRNSEGSPGLAPPISISEPSPLPDGTRPILFDEANTSDESVLQNKSSPPSPEPDYLKPETRIKKKSRSRASSVTSSIFSDIRGSAHNQKVSLMGKIKSRHSGDLSDVEVNSIEAPSSIAPSVTPSTVSAKRNQEFHALFRSVPEEDGLVTDYGCALQKEILLQGRIYISQNYLCFNANIFGWVTNLVIAFADITEIEKKSTAIFIPNAIQISTEGGKHFFASFLSRDTAYDLIVDQWYTIRPEMAPKPEPEPEPVLASSSSSSSLDEDGSSYYDSDTESESEAVEENDGKVEEADKNQDAVPRQESLPVLKSVAKATELRRRAVSELPKPSKNFAALEETKPATAEITQVHEKTTCECSADHYPNIVQDQVYPGTIQSMYNLFFKDPFMKDFLANNQKTTELTIGEWKKDGDKDTTREMSYIKPLTNPLGPKSTKCNITEQVLHYDTDKYISVLTTTCTPDVPSGGSFSCKTRTCFTFAGKGLVRVLVSVLVEFTKSSWLKSTIEKASIDGQTQYYKDLDVAIRSHLKSSGKPSSRRTKRKKRSKRPLEEKPPAEPKEPDTLVHRVLGQGSRLLADGITGLIEAITSPKSSHIILLCLFFMIIVNMLIAKKMMSVEKQLGELKGTFPAQQEKLAFHKRHYQRQEEDDLWDWLGRIDPDKPVLNNNIYPNLEGQDPAVWDDALEASKITKDKLERHMVDLNHMILKAEGNLAQISRAVHDQGRKIKETS